MFNWTGLFLFLATAVLFFVFGMMIMCAVDSKERYKATTKAYNLGYENGVKEERERIGNLLDDCILNLERGKRRDSEGISVSDSVS